MQENELDVMQRIASHSVKMSKGQKRIASFILNHYDRASFMTAANLGLCADVSVLPWRWGMRASPRCRRPCRNWCATS